MGFRTRCLGVMMMSALCAGALAPAQAEGLPEARLDLAVPAIRPDPLREAALDAFAAELSACVAGGQAEAAQGRTVLAPFGGSKVRPFKELDARGVVLVGWERPGTPETVARAFAEPDRGLRDVLERARWSGGMDTPDVMRVPLAAQVLGLLYLEMGVDRVELRYLRPPADAPGPAAEPDRSAFDGAPLGDADPPLLLAFRFTWRGLPRTLVYLAYKISSDLLPDRDALPRKDLARLRPQGFDAAYLSADGLALFSAYPDNFGHRASAQVLETLAGGGVVVLDYPQADEYRRAFFEPRLGFWLLGGRALLKPWGLDLLRRIPVDQPVFGYCGSTLGDCVLVWRKPGTRTPERGSAPPLFLAHYQEVGPPVAVRLLPPREGAGGVTCATGPGNR